MNIPTQKITTPISKTEVEIKDWITGGDAEYIDQALMSAVDIRIDETNKKINPGKFDTGSIVEQIHREIERFIVSVNGQTKDIVKLVTGLPEDDYDFVKIEIEKRRKKKVE